MDISKHLDKNNLHHAYLLEGTRDKILPEILSLMKVLDVATVSNPDFCEIYVDNFKMEEALFLRSMTEEKSFVSGKKIFIISANKFSLDAEHALLKMFEEPKENTHFFLIVPDKNALLPTLFSRFYFIPTKFNSNDTVEVDNFLKMPLSARINFLKEFLKDDGEDDVVAKDSVRAKSLRFLNILETVLHDNFLRDSEHGRFQPEAGGKWKNLSENLFTQIFKVRKFLRQPGSSTKSLMESLALIIPIF